MKGVKPKGKKQYIHKSFYLYGTVCPSNGENLFWEFPSLNGECFQLFLEEFGKTHSKGLHIMFLDNAKWHFAKNLRLPKNLVLLPLPAYSPELNPMERVWEELKKILAWENFKDLEQLSEKVVQIIEQFTPSILKSLTLYPYIREACIG